MTVTGIPYAVYVTITVIELYLIRYGFFYPFYCSGLAPSGRHGSALGRNEDSRDSLAQEREKLSASPGPSSTGEKLARLVIVDFDESQHFSRVKGNFETREMQLRFIFRTVDRARWPHIMGRDFIFNPAEYFGVFVQQHSLFTRDRIASFASARLWDGVSHLPFIASPTLFSSFMCGQLDASGVGTVQLRRSTTTGLLSVGVPRGTRQARLSAEEPTVDLMHAPVGQLRSRLQPPAGRDGGTRAAAPVPPVGLPPTHDLQHYLRGLSHYSDNSGIWDGYCERPRR